MCVWCATGMHITRSACVSGALRVCILPVAHVCLVRTRHTCATGMHITRSAPHMRYEYFFTSDVLPAAQGICATGSHIRCATGKLFSSSAIPLWRSRIHVGSEQVTKNRVTICIYSYIKNTITYHISLIIQ
jgi:hypothetical protein